MSVSVSEVWGVLSPWALYESLGNEWSLCVGTRLEGVLAPYRALFSSESWGGISGEEAWNCVGWRKCTFWSMVWGEDLISCRWCMYETTPHHQSDARKGTYDRSKFSHQRPAYWLETWGSIFQKTSPWLWWSPQRWKLAMVCICMSRSQTVKNL